MTLSIMVKSCQTIRPHQSRRLSAEIVILTIETLMPEGYIIGSDEDIKRYDDDDVLNG